MSVTRAMTFPGLDVSDLVQTASADHGEVFTRAWVVELILDLCGYTPDVDLTSRVLVEPSVGGGAFLSIALDRLLAARRKHNPDQPWQALSGAFVAMDLQAEHVSSCRAMAARRLQLDGCPAALAEELAKTWVRVGDFLLADTLDLSADFVVGNPPYIRIEGLQPALLKAYRRACPTMGGRADVYVGFFERGLDLLKPAGRLGFVCADRWMRNQYGRGLREKIISGGFAVDTCLVMHDASAFEDQVAAYPAIAVIRRGQQSTVATGDATESFDHAAARLFAAWTATQNPEPIKDPAVRAARLPHWHRSADSWPDGSPQMLAWLEDLADRLPPLEDASTGTRIGIGVATGADAVYVTRDPYAVEPERLLPLATTADVKTGHYKWTGSYLVNPWTADGLVKLADWPRLAQYLGHHAAAARRRAIARKLPLTWHRTIDRVTTSLTDRPKLLLEDMKAHVNPVLEAGGRYPHHNLYYVVSDVWDLEVLGGLLLSDVVEQQVAAYCVKMRGKTLRFQAQYLRRIRVPTPQSLSEGIRTNLIQAFRDRNRVDATNAAMAAYGMTMLPV